MPLKFWDEAFVTATYLINRIPNKVIDYTTPLERLLHVKPNYAALRVFGCACWPNLKPYNTHKLSFRSKQCVFLGYSTLHKGFKCLDPSSGRVYVSRDVTFDEQVVRDGIPDEPEDADEADAVSDGEQDAGAIEAGPRRSKRENKANPRFYGPDWA